MSWFPLLNRQATPTEFVEAITIPEAAENYTYRLKYVPALNRSPAVSFSGLSSSGGGYTIVSHLPTAPGEVYLKTSTGELTFHSSDGGLSAGNGTYNKLGSLVDAEAMNELFDLVMAAVGGGREFHHLSVIGVPDPASPSGDGTYAYCGSFTVPTNGGIREISRITMSAQDLIDVTGTTQLYFDLGGAANVTDPLLVLPADEVTRSVSFETPPEGWEIDTTEGAVVVDVWSTAGGHGNLNIEIEVS